MTREEALEMLRREARGWFAEMGLDEDAMMEHYRPEDDILLPYLVTEARGQRAPVSREVHEEWQLVRTRGERRAVYGRSRSGAQLALELFTAHAPYGPADVEWAIEKHVITDDTEAIRLMTGDEVAEARDAEARRYRYPGED